MRQVWLTATLLLLAACGQAQNKTAARENLASFDVEAPANAPPAPAQGPQIAYSYQLTYALDEDRIAATQAAAVAACRALGTARCLVTKTDLARDTQGHGDAASVSLLVDARLAGGFNQRLDAAVAGAGGHATGRHVSAEDVTKQIVDTQARVRAKQALADRLLGLIRTAQGRVGDLVAAEKAYAEVQEELDAARSLDAELRQRVAMSAVDIQYVSTRESGTWSPVTRAADGLADSFAGSIGAVITFVAVAIPWALLLALVVWLLRRIGWRPRWPWRRRPPVETPSPA